MSIAAGDLNRRIRIERPIADEAADGAGSSSWAVVGKAWAQVQDVLPSRGERQATGINLATRPARVRMRFRTDVTPDMRFCLLRNSGGVETVVRVMQIIAGPAELGRREGLEFMVEDYSSAGNG